MTMHAVKAHFSQLAAQLREADSLMDGWLPIWQCIDVVCGVQWQGLSHATKTAVGAWLRDAFQSDFDFEMTPVRLTSKASGRGSQMLAAYPPVWVLCKREQLLVLLGEATASHPFLPFQGEVDCD